MRVLEVEFDMNVGVGPFGTGAQHTRWFSAAKGHDMHWLPDEQVLLIDGWRYSTRGARWRCEVLAAPTDDTSMFRPLKMPDPTEPIDGPDQPSSPGRPARGKKRPRKV